MRFVAVGHVVDDVVRRKGSNIVLDSRLGGGVSYSAIAARRFGYEAHIITKCPPGHRYVNDLRQMGVRVHLLPTKLDTITSFCNEYDDDGSREQFVDVAKNQEPISLPDLSSFPEGVLSGAAVLVAPVIGEVDMDLYPALARSKMLAITPQGYFRKIDSAGVVTQKRWSGFEGNLRHASATIFSEEDIAITSNGPDFEMLKAVAKECRIVALTRGKNGASIYQDGNPTQIGAFPILKGEAKDWTGAGDTFATVLVTELARGVGLKAAGVSAAFFAALKIIGVVAGKGVDSIPTIDELVQFKEANKQRVQDFLKQERASHISLFETDAVTRSSATNIG